VPHFGENLRLLPVLRGPARALELRLLGVSVIAGARFEIGAFGFVPQKGLVRMRRLDFSRFGFFTVVSILSLGFAAVGCGGGGGDDDDGSGGSGATGGTGGTGAGADAVTWDATGWVDPGGNAFGIMGPWYSYNDCANAMPAGLPCTVPDMGLMGPDMMAGWQPDATKVCTKGVAPQVVMDMYSLQWGAGIALDMANMGGASTVKGDWNADAAGVAGFLFDISTVGGAPADVRVNIKTKATGDGSHFVTIVLPKTNAEVLFSKALQGSWVMPPAALDTTKIESIQFQVYTNTSAPKPFDFCVSNMRAIRK
jgi:hypothetical protein